MSDGFSGAEIEQAIVAAMYEAFAQDREFTQLDIIAALKATLPLSRTMQEQVTALRDWARQRARPELLPSLNISDWSFKSFPLQSQGGKASCLQLAVRRKKAAPTHAASL